MSMQTCSLKGALSGACQKECESVSLSGFWSSACMCLHGHEHACDIRQKTSL